ncbi:UNVERIFIED_CONTAM: Membrane protein of ER body-like protein [Sesamum latifolium]|uniref:Membrane protein of ER body-like protein n=1 Tax=Sesamum latifolium TaxID=2727402 RepID=A0AAW2Y2K6_9LAMI
MMEVMQPRMPEEQVEQPPSWQPDETAASTGDSTGSSSSSSSSDENNDVSEKSVYFDKNEGMWKCHHCIWTYKIGNSWVDHVHQKSFNHATRGTTLQLSLSGENLRVEDLDIPKLINTVINNQNAEDLKDKSVSGLNVPKLVPTPREEEENTGTSTGRVKEKVKIDIEEESDEEITKVILRRKIRGNRTRSAGNEDGHGRDKPVDLLGCLACFSIFIPSGNCLNPFRIFGGKGKQESPQTVQEQPSPGASLSAVESPQTVQEQPASGASLSAVESPQTVQEQPASGASLSAVAGGSTNAGGSTTLTQGGFDLFWMFRNRGEKDSTQESKGKEQIKHDGGSKNEEENFSDESGERLPVSSSHAPLLHGRLPSTHETNDENNGSLDKSTGALPGSSLRVPLLHGPSSSAGKSKDNKNGSGGDVAIDIRDGSGNIYLCRTVLLNMGSYSNAEEERPVETRTEQGRDINVSSGGRTGAISGAGRSQSLEILKCIVYGGLMETIASLSIVSSTAASDATTLNTVNIGLATLVSGLLVFGQNLMDLKNYNSGGDSNQSTDKYQELLGRRGHFLFHATFAILSFILFGLVPPVVYGFAFRESDNKDYKILAVAAASFTCVFILAIAKAYVKRAEKFTDYVKTILYYITMAVSVSGVAYAAGDLCKMLMDRFGWFNFQPTPAAPSFVPDMISGTPAWVSY